MRATFFVSSDYCGPLELKAEDGAWKAIVRGEQRGTDECSMSLKCTSDIVAALVECLNAEEGRGEGIKNLNVLLTSLKAAYVNGFVGSQFDTGMPSFENPEIEWERLESGDEIRWFFNDITLHRGDEVIQKHYDVKRPLPEGVPAKIGQALSEMFEMDSWDLKNYDQGPGSLVEYLAVTSIELEMPHTASPRDVLSVIRELTAKKPAVQQQPVLWPIILTCGTPSMFDDEWPEMSAQERIEHTIDRLTAIKNVTEELLDASRIKVFIGERKTRDQSASLLSFSPTDSREESGKWFSYDDAFRLYLDKNNPSSVNRIDDDYLVDEQMMVGFLSPTVFVSTSIGCEISNRLSSFFDDSLGNVSVYDTGLNALRIQEYSEGEVSSGIFGDFSESGVGHGVVDLDGDGHGQEWLVDSVDKHSIKMLLQTLQ